MDPKKSRAPLPPRDNQVSKYRPVTCDNFPSPLDSLQTIKCEMTLLRRGFCVHGQDSSPRQTRDTSPRARVDTVEFFHYAGHGISFKMTFLSADNSFLLCNDRQPAQCTTACLCQLRGDRCQCRVRFLISFRSRGQKRASKPQPS